jgi:hypothetical protein
VRRLHGASLSGRWATTASTLPNAPERRNAPAKFLREIIIREAVHVVCQADAIALMIDKALRLEPYSRSHNPRRCRVVTAAFTTGQRHLPVGRKCLSKFSA